MNLGPHRDFGKCRFEDCGKPQYVPEHTVGHEEFAHRFLGVAAVHRRTARAKAPRLCTSCATGQHAGRKTDYGCTETVAPEPNDFVCSCPTCQHACRTAEHTTRGRCDMEGVVRCRL